VNFWQHAGFSKNTKIVLIWLAVGLLKHIATVIKWIFARASCIGLSMGNRSMMT
jgi:hypothetical protein